VLFIFALAGCGAAHALVPIGEESYLEQVVLSELSEGTGLDGPRFPAGGRVIFCWIRGWFF
jgi:hypothetical protein